MSSIQVEVDIFPAATSTKGGSTSSVAPSVATNTSIVASAIKRHSHHGDLAIGTDNFDASTESLSTGDGNANEKKPWWKTHQKQAWKRNSKGKV